MLEAPTIQRCAWRADRSQADQRWRADRALLAGSVRDRVRRSDSDDDSPWRAWRVSSPCYSPALSRGSPFHRAGRGRSVSEPERGDETVTHLWPKPLHSVGMNNALRSLMLIALLATACAAPVTVAPSPSVAPTVAATTPVAATSSPAATTSVPVTTAPPVFPCGRVAALTPPTASAAGSIVLGTTTFQLAPGSWPNPPPPVATGSVSCLSGEQNPAGQFLAQFTLVGDTLCGTVGAFTAASATTPGSITIVGKRSVNIPVRAGVTLSAAQTTGSQCFNSAFNAAGDTEIVGSAPR